MNRISKRFTTEKLLDILLLSQNATAIYATDDMIIETANDAMIAFWGKDKKVIGKPLLEAVPELKGQPFLGMLQKVLHTGITDSGKAIPAELLIDGKMSTYYYDYEYRPIKDGTGKTYCILHTAHDVTELVLSQQALGKAKEKEVQLEIEQVLNEQLATANEELSATNEELHQMQEGLHLLNNELEERVLLRTKELAEKEARLRYMLADAPVAIAVLKGRDLVIESANKKVLEAWGKTDKIIGNRLPEAIPELIGQDFLSIMDSVFINGEPFYGNEVKALLEKNGKTEEVYSNFVYQPLKDTEGRTTSIMLAAIVITEQVLARKKVEHAEEMLQLALEAANIGTWFIHTKTRELITTPRLRELFGFDPYHELTFEQLIEQVTDDYRDLLINELNNAINTGRNYDITYTMKRSNDQKIIWLRSLGKLGRDETGHLNIFSGVVMDITEQKQDEQRKNDFISMVSHELKTPLTSLTAYVQIMQSKPGQHEARFVASLMDKMSIQLKKMSAMINGFLNVSRLESGKIHLDKSDFNLTDLIIEMVEEAKLTTSNHPIYFSPCSSIIVHADEPKIGSVISNLLSNAIKYSLNGKPIEVKCQVIDKMVQISVEDQGMGIKAQDLEKLFERFYRVNTQSTQNISGFGIGLYLSAEIIQRHNGKIWAESIPDKGSIFYFSIPLV